MPLQRDTKAKPSAEETAKHNATLPFFKLPAELRTHIYRFVLTDLYGQDWNPLKSKVKYVKEIPKVEYASKQIREEVQHMIEDSKKRRGRKG